MRGRLVYVMGASGAGKDSLIREILRRFRGLPLAAVRRHITRPASAEGERHIAVSRERFEELASAGRFSLHWTSHGHHYGISVHAEQALACGVSLLVNGSRAAFAEAVRRYPNLIPVLVTAKPHLLRERLLARGRESGAELEERLAGALLALPDLDSLPWIRIDNSGHLHEAASLLEQELRSRLPLSGQNRHLGRSSSPD